MASYIIPIVAGSAIGWGAYAYLNRDTIASQQRWEANKKQSDADNKAQYKKLLGVTEQVSSTLTKLGFKHAVTGSVALQLYGYQLNRWIRDVDVMVDVPPKLTDAEFLAKVAGPEAKRLPADDGGYDPEELKSCISVKIAGTTVDFFRNGPIAEKDIRLIGGTFNDDTDLPLPVLGLQRVIDRKIKIGRGKDHRDIRTIKDKLPADITTVGLFV